MSVEESSTRAPTCGRTVRRGVAPVRRVPRPSVGVPRAKAAALPLRSVRSPPARAGYDDPSRYALWPASRLSPDHGSAAQSEPQTHGTGSFCERDGSTAPRAPSAGQGSASAAHIRGGCLAGTPPAEGASDRPLSDSATGRLRQTPESVQGLRFPLRDAPSSTACDERTSDAQAPRCRPCQSSMLAVSMVRVVWRPRSG